MKKKNKKLIEYVFLLVIVLLIASFFVANREKPVAASFLEGPEDISRARIGVQLGTTSDLIASEEEKNGATVVRFSKTADAIQAMMKDQLDCVLVDSMTAGAFADANPGVSIMESNYPVEEMAIAISKNNPILKDKINRALALMREDGTYQSIRDNYFGEDKGLNPYVKQDVDRSNGTLIAVTNATFEPYEYIENGKIVGFDIDIAQAICDHMGYELEMNDIEFDAIITAVQSGKADIGIAGMTVTEDRLKNIDFTDVYAREGGLSILVRNGNNEGDMSFKDKLVQNFLEENRWSFLLNGLVTTIIIAIIASFIGIVLGSLIAFGRTTADMTGEYKIMNAILKCYLTIIRGTPAVIQLLIIYYVIFASSNVNKVLVAGIAFGLNSAAYVAEIMRSGIMSIDKGQFEAGRSLGFSYGKTLWYFILPQAIRNVLPALGNEFIVLIKETSISGYIGIMDLTRAGDFIRSRTYEAFIPLVAVAAIYLVIVIFLSKGVSMMEKKLKTSSH
ncbi:MAG: ABC transporter substrate-binding protein/permease [Sphaerochaetaceae bacterium]|nr:ABC transporter substrate-binding protein/permease [Sphaerochaetaceae bacterium]